MQSKTSFTVGLDASEITSDIMEADKLVYSDFLPKVAAVGVSEVLETSIGVDNQLVAAVTTVCQSGNVGQGNVTLNWRRPLFHPALRVDNGIGFGARKFLSTALIYQVDQKSTASLQVANFLQGGTVFPQLSGSFSRVIRGSLVGTAHLNTPLQNPLLERTHLNLSLTNKTSPEVKSPITFNVSVPFGDPVNSVLEIKKTIAWDDSNEIRLKGVASAQGIHGVDFGIHRKFNKRTRGSATLQFDAEGAVNLRLGITHDHLHLILPIRFSQEFSPAAIVLASLIPSLGDWITRRWLNPLLMARQREQYWAEFKQKQAALIERKREEAEMTIELLTQLLAKRATVPSLVIKEAQYRSKSSPAWNVTVALQFLVTPEGSLYLPAGYRANVLGFYDIDPGNEKELFISYHCNGRDYEAIIPDTVDLILPQKSHLK